MTYAYYYNPHANHIDAVYMYPSDLEHIEKYGRFTFSHGRTSYIVKSSRILFMDHTTAKAAYSLLQDINSIFQAGTFNPFTDDILYLPDTHPEVFI